MLKRNARKLVRKTIKVNHNIVRPPEAVKSRCPVFLALTLCTPELLKFVHERKLEELAVANGLWHFKLPGCMLYKPAVNVLSHVHFQSHTYEIHEEKFLI